MGFGGGDGRIGQNRRKSRQPFVLRTNSSGKGMTCGPGMSAAGACSGPAQRRWLLRSAQCRWWAVGREERRGGLGQLGWASLVRSRLGFFLFFYFLFSISFITFY